MAIFLRKKDHKTVRKVLIGLWAFGSAVVAIYYVTTYILCGLDLVNHPFIIAEMLPLHSCLMLIYVFPFAMWVKNKTSQNQPE